MEILSRVKENWLTRKPHSLAEGMTIGLGFLLFGLGFLYFSDLLNSHQWMAATPASVFQKHEYWRLWTSLFAHGDFGHLLGNAFLFLPFAYLLFGYFGVWLFPLSGILLGGVINFIVLKTMPENVALIGISGVVYWMGAAYSTLYFLIDTRRSRRWRFAAVLFMTMVLFIPDTYKPEVSYMSHFVGYVLGVLSAGLYYVFHRREIKASEEIEYLFDDSIYWDPTALSEGIEHFSPVSE